MIQQAPVPASPRLMPFVADPRELLANYYRCPRCLYLRIRRNDARYAELEPRDFRASAIRALAERVGKGWIDVGGRRFRILAQGVPLRSVFLPHRQGGLALAFRSYADALIETDDGFVAVAGYQKAVRVERREHDRRLILEAEALALEHPVRGVPRKIDRLATLSFLTAGMRPDAEASHPIHLRLDGRESGRLARVVGLIARQVTAPSPPSPAPQCHVCTQVIARTA